MVQFHITKKRTSLPSKASTSNQIHNKQYNLQPGITLNQEAFSRVKSKNLQIDLTKFQNDINNKSITARFRATQPSFRKTSFSFNNKKPVIDDYQNQMFRKTTLSMKNIAKKNSFFDQFITCEQNSSKYKIIGQIGKGSFSIVSSAFDKQNNRYVAVKIYQKINSLSWHRLQNIKKQIHSLQKLSHQNVVTLYDIIKQKNKLMLFMENCGKQTLSGMLRKSKLIDQNQSKKMFTQIVQGVRHFHSKGICHRDLKPENVLIDQNGSCKIIDFGFSSLGKTYLTSYCGTPPFMCPQIVQKRPYSGMKADIWALGVILFLILNGKLPFKASTQQQLYRIIQGGKVIFSQSCVNENAKRLILKMLKVCPEERINAEQILNQKWLRV